MQLASQLQDLSIRRVVLWGLRTTFNDTFYFIHKGLYETLKKLNIPAIWVDDKESNIDALRNGDLVYAVDRAAQFLPARTDVKYCLHNISEQFIKNLKPEQYVAIQVLTLDRFLEGREQSRPLDAYLHGTASYDFVGNVLYWGAPMLARDFLAPMNFPLKKSEYFVGTIWDNELGQGNARVIAEYEKLLREKRIQFKCVKGAPEFFNPIYVRHSAIGASIVGDWQREHGYTPCRLFKAVSYGRIGAINSDNSKIQYPWTMANENIGELIEDILQMSDTKTKELIRFQQKALKQETYEAKIANVCTVLASKV
jgi:hypothetical protein